MRLSLLPRVLALLVVFVAGGARAACSLGQLAEVPVTMSGPRPLIPAKINGHDGMFLADTGAFFNTLAPDSLAKFGLSARAAPMELSVGGAGGMETKVSLATAKDFTFADIPFHDAKFLVLAKDFGPREDGLIGENVFSAFDIEYDFARGAMRLFIPKGCERASLAYWAGSAPFSAVDVTGAPSALGHQMTYARLNGRLIHVLFDTGASVSTLSLEAAAAVGVKPGDAGVVAASDMSGVARHSQFATWIAPFTSFQIGDEEIRDTRLRIGRTGLEDQGVEMLVGADFFLSHRVLVSNSQHKLYFTYNGGAVFNLGAKPTVASVPPTQTDADSDAPTGADGFARRAAALESRGAFDDAIADLTQAMKLAPTEAKYPFQRGFARLGSGHSDLADADFTLALKLAPDDVPALLARATLRHANKRDAEALADLAAADKAADKAADGDPATRLAIATAFEQMGLHKESITQLDRWIAAHPDDTRLPAALNERCWSRALLGQDLDKALADCDRSLKLDPGNPNVLDSRALVRLRLGDIDQSIGDYQAALRLIPNSAWTHYGHGLALLKKGRAADGQAEIKQAMALKPDIVDEVKAAGLTP